MAIGRVESAFRRTHLVPDLKLRETAIWPSSLSDLK